MRYAETVNDSSVEADYPDCGVSALPIRDGAWRNATREAVRAVVRNPKDGRIALVWSEYYGHYMLPGGGIDADESPDVALARELREEAGVADYRITSELGIVAEHRLRLNFMQINHGYLVDAFEISAPEWTAEESEEGSEIRWLLPDEALRALSDPSPTAYTNAFEQHRSLRILRLALPFLFSE